MLTVSPPAYRMCVVTIGFATPIDSLVALRNRLVHRREPSSLSLDGSASNPNLLLLRSTSGHSLLQIQPHEATLQTTYSGNTYTAHDAEGARLRAEYATEKLRAVTQLFDENGVRIALLGVTVTARIVAPEPLATSLREAAVRAFHLAPTFTEGGAAFDFVVRASRALDDNVFSNLQVSWFQERSINIQIRADQIMLQPFLLREWEMTLTSEGLELSYDRNNKRGLFAGRREWSTDEFLDLLSGTMQGSADAFTQVQKTISGGVGS